MADQMMGSPAKLAQFVAKVDEAVARAGRRARTRRCSPSCRQRDPAMQKISAADARYWQEQYRRAKFNFDSQSVRPYFPYAAVEKGVLDTASKLFHVQIKPVAGLKHLAPLGHHLRGLRRRHQARHHLPRHAPARGQGQVVLDARRSPPARAGGSCPTARWCAISPAARPGTRA